MVLEFQKVRNLRVDEEEKMIWTVEVTLPPVGGATSKSERAILIVEALVSIYHQAGLKGAAEQKKMDRFNHSISWQDPRQTPPGSSVHVRGVQTTQRTVQLAEADSTRFSALEMSAICYE